MGYEKDAYYGLFASEVCKITLQVMVPVRRLTNTVNYLMTDKPLTLKKLRELGISPEDTSPRSG